MSVLNKSFQIKLNPPYNLHMRNIKVIDQSALPIILSLTAEHNPQDKCGQDI